MPDKAHPHPYGTTVVQGPKIDLFEPPKVGPEIRVAGQVQLRPDSAGQIQLRPDSEVSRLRAAIDDLINKIGADTPNREVAYLRADLIKVRDDLIRLRDARVDGPSLEERIQSPESMVKNVLRKSLTNTIDAVVALIATQVTNDVLTALAPYLDQRVARPEPPYEPSSDLAATLTQTVEFANAQAAEPEALPDPPKTLRDLGHRVGCLMIDDVNPTCVKDCPMKPYGPDENGNYDLSDERPYRGA